MVTTWLQATDQVAIRLDLKRQITVRSSLTPANWSSGNIIYLHIMQHYLSDYLIKSDQTPLANLNISLYPPWENLGLLIEDK